MTSWNFALQTCADIQTRLKQTARYFSFLFVSFVVIFFGLILSAIQNLNNAWNGHETTDLYKVFQDVLFLFLGTIGLYCGLWTSCSLSVHWQDVILQINAFTSTIRNPQLLPLHAALLQHIQLLPIGHLVCIKTALYADK
jgi:hypothetical protein